MKEVSRENLKSKQQMENSRNMVCNMKEDNEISQERVGKKVVKD